MTAVGRHAPATVIQDYHEAGVAGVLQAAGAPAAQIRISPQKAVLTLLVQVTENVPRPEVEGLAHVAYELQELDGGMWHRLDVGYDDNLAEVYSVLCAIIDRVQLTSQSFPEAVWSVLEGLSEILEGRGGLSQQHEVGLIGELAVLLSAAAASSVVQAVSSWRGPKREEHDFGLQMCDLEVKTTTSEQRGHWISSFKQLLASPHRELLLLSIQITPAGNGPGVNLNGLVSAARKLPGVDARVVEQGLSDAGYRDRHADLYRSRWNLRSVPAFYAVDESFPAVTLDRLATVVPAVGCLTDVRYRLNLDSLTPVAGPFPVTFQVEVS